MDFFATQDRARRRTWLLVVLFAVAVAAIAAAVHLVFAALWWWQTDDVEAVRDWALFLGMLQDYRMLSATASATVLVILGASAIKISSLARGGGAAVAQSLGALRINRNTVDFRERRLLNVVDEIAIASGVPVPPVYLLAQEPGINAFAAGFAPHQAVVAVTMGALTELDRDELQGVVAHEFSHILNGDMRLNITLMGAVHGILVLHLLGREMVYSARFGGTNSNGRAVVLAMGLALMAIGWIGALCAEMIKATVSRQREFLADAAAVQFTRNPGGLAGALGKIGGLSSQLSHPRAEALSHMYFGEGIKGLFASHPPIAERLEWLRAVMGADVPAHAPIGGVDTGAAMGFAAARNVVDALPGAMRDALSTSHGAQAVVMALLAVDDPDALTMAAGGPAAAARMLMADVRSIPTGSAVAVVDLAVPALAELPGSERKAFLATLDAMVGHDGRVTAFERAVAQLLHAALSPTKATALPGAKVLAVAASRVLSALAHAGHDDEAVARQAYGAALVQYPDASAEELADRSGCGPWALGRALDVLQAAPPLKKRAFMKAAETAIEFDNTVTPAERRVLAVVAQSLGIPSASTHPYAT